MKSKILNPDIILDTSLPETNYWLGFIFADGTIGQTTSNRYQFQISLSIIDREHLDKLQRYLSSTYRLTLIPSRSELYPNGKYYTRKDKLMFSTKNQQLCQNLLRHNIVPNKQLRENPPQYLCNNKDFWRGMIDGDGSLDGPNSYLKRSFGLCGSLIVCQQFKIYCDKIVPSARVNIATDKSIYRIRYGGLYAKILAEHFYKDSTIHLNRKYAIAEQWWKETTKS